LAGFAVPSITGGVLAAMGLADTFAFFALVILAGIGEGAVLGLAQWLALRRYLPGIAWREWVIATGSAAGAAWLIGMSLSALGGAPEVTPQLMIAIAIPLGIIFLLLMGGAQWFVLRRRVSRAGWWIVANAVAWPVGVAVPVVALSLVPDNAAAWMMIAVGVISGILMGVVVGAITGFALARLVRSPLPQA
jgi:hypothetical protein